MARRRRSQKTPPRGKGGKFVKGKGRKKKGSKGKSKSKPKGRKSPAKKKGNPKPRKRRKSSGGGFNMKDMNITLVTISGGGLVGLSRRMDLPVPALPVLGDSGTIGLALLVAGVFTKTKWLKKMGNGALSVTLSELAEGEETSGEEGRTFSDAEVEQLERAAAAELDRDQLKNLGRVIRILKEEGQLAEVLDASGMSHEDFAEAWPDEDEETAGGGEQFTMEEDLPGEPQPE